MRLEAREEIDRLQLKDDDFCVCEDNSVDVVLQANMLYKCMKCEKVLKQQGD